MSISGINKHLLTIITDNEFTAYSLRTSFSYIVKELKLKPATLVMDTTEHEGKTRVRISTNDTDISAYTQAVLKLIPIARKMATNSNRIISLEVNDVVDKVLEGMSIAAKEDLVNLIQGKKT